MDLQQLQLLRDTFPSLDHQIIQDAFVANNYDNWATVNQLLDLTQASKRNDAHNQSSAIIDLSNLLNTEDTQINHQRILPKINTPDSIDLTSSSPSSSPDVFHTPKSKDDEQKQPTIQSLDTCLQSVLSVIPDVDPSYVEKSYVENRLLHSNIAEFIVNAIFETDGSYPKSEKVTINGRKRKIEEVNEVKPFDYNAPGRQPLCDSTSYYTIW